MGIAGEYAVMTELIINGFAAARTDGNSKDVDILCSHIETGHVANVQVKTLNPNTDIPGREKDRFFIATPEYTTNTLLVSGL